MQKICSMLKRQDGSILPVALMILVLLTVIGFAATRTGVIELQISGNEQDHKIAFYAAESGWRVAVNWLEIQYPEISTDVGLGLDPDDGHVTFSAENYNNSVFDADSTFAALSNISSYSSDVAFDGAQGNVPGYGTDFKRYRYNIDSAGTGPGSAGSMLSVTAGKIVYLGGY